MECLGVFFETAYTKICGHEQPTVLVGIQVCHRVRWHCAMVVDFAEVYLVLITVTFAQTVGSGYPYIAVGILDNSSNA